MTKLKLGPDLTLDDDAFFQPWGILAMRGAGKTNAARVMAEELHKAGRPFVAIDPVGAWWGLRASRDGKPDGGLPIPIFGGDHGDVPLEESGGEVLADFLVEETASAVVDVSALSESAKHRFLTAFTERLFRRNSEPLVVFLEEADDYAPQRSGKGPALATLGAMQRLVKRGRFKGLVPVMVTQRSAAINKDLLTQIENLVVLRTTSPQDRKAIEGWVTYHGQSAELLESLSSLETGEAWLWSPHALGTLERFRFRESETFDSGATPRGGKRRVASLADVDLGALRDRMAATIEKAKAEDPRELRRQIAALKKEISARPAVAEARADPVIQEVEVRVEVPVPVLDGEQLAAVIALQEQMEQVEHALTAAEATIGAVLAVTTPRREVRTPKPPREVRSQGTPAAAPRAMARAATKPPPAVPRGDDAAPDPDFAVGRSEQKVLDALAWLAAAGIEPASKQQLGWVAEYKPSGGRFNNLLGQLRGARLIAYPTAGTVMLTSAGAAIADDPGGAVTTMDLQQRILGMLPASEAKVLQVVLESHPDPLAKADLAASSGYEPSGGRFNNILGRLRSLGLIDYPSSGWVEATDTLFVGGR